MVVTVLNVKDVTRAGEEAEEAEEEVGEGVVAVIFQIRSYIGANSRATFVTWAV